MDEGRKRVLLIAAAVLAARKLSQYGGWPSIRTRALSRHGGWPIQACFWLEWGGSDFLNSAIPTGADHREAMICGVEGSYVFGVVEIESEWTGQHANEREADSVQLWNYPTQAKSRLEWATPSSRIT